MPVFQNQKSGKTCSSFEAIFVKRCFSHPQKFKTRTKQKDSSSSSNHHTVKALMHKNTVWVFWQALWPPLGCSWVSHDLETLLPSHCAENQPGTLRKVTGWKSSLSPVTTCCWQIKCLRRVAAPCYVSSSITRTMVHLSSTNRSVQNLPLVSNQIWESW